MKRNVQKMELIQEKLKHLKDEQNKIEQELIEVIIGVLKARDAFQIDFDAMVGGILVTIETIRSDPVKKEAWKMMGNKFCKENIITKCKKINRDECTMEKSHG